MSAVTKLSCLALLLMGSVGFAESHVPQFHTVVAPKDGEDVARPCEYELFTPSHGPFRAVFVIYERGRDVQSFLTDPLVKLFAEKENLALMMPRHCASKGREDIDVDPAKGLGRSLLTALDQFAEEAKHPELKTAPLVVLGFSGAGSLAGRLAGFAPDRVAAVVLAHAGQYDPLGLDTIQHTAASVEVPEFILVGSIDDHVGTKRAFDYFNRYWQAGAPWIFVTQNNVPHCCVVNARDLILEWVDAVLTLRLDSGKPGIALVDRNKGYRAYVELAETDIHDQWKLPTSEVVRASFYGSRDSSMRTGIPAGWLPSKKVADAWKAFVVMTSHPVTSLP